MTIFGVAAYMLVARFGLLELRPLIGSDKEKRFAGAVRLSKMPYFAGGILACVAGSLNPQGMILVALSAAASTFGGTSGLLWMMNWLKGYRIPLGSEPESTPIRRNWPWIVIAFVLVLAFVAVLGPGVRLYGASGSRPERRFPGVLPRLTDGHTSRQRAFPVNVPVRAEWAEPKSVTSEVH